LLGLLDGGIGLNDKIIDAIAIVLEERADLGLCRVELLGPGAGQFAELIILVDCVACDLLRLGQLVPLRLELGLAAGVSRVQELRRHGQGDRERHERGDGDLEPLRFVSCGHGS